MRNTSKSKNVKEHLRVVKIIETYIKKQNGFVDDTFKITEFDKRTGIGECYLEMESHIPELESRENECTHREMRLQRWIFVTEEGGRSTGGLVNETATAFINRDCLIFGEIVE